MVSLDELRKGKAKELNIKGRWKMRKAELEEAISRAQDDKKIILPNKIEKPIPKPRTIFPEGVKPIPTPRNIVPNKIEKAIPKPRTIFPNKIEKPIPTPRNIASEGVKPITNRRKEESWFDWFVKNLRRVAKGLIKYIPEGKVKDNATIKFY